MSNVQTQYANDAFTTILNPTLSPAETVISVQDDSLFPVVADPVYFYATLEDEAGQIEIVKVVTHVFGSGEFTVERGQDNTAGVAWLAGDYIEMRPCSAVFEELRDHNHNLDYANIIHEHDAEYVNVSGDIMTGQLKGIDPVAADDFTRKDYVDSQSMTRSFLEERNIRLIDDIPKTDPGGGEQPDADAIVLSGFYQIDPTVQHLPAGVDTGVLSHFNDANTEHYQMIHELVTNKLWLRHFDATWKDWQAVITSDVYATSTVGGTVKMRVSGGDLYITNNGDDA